MQHNDNQNAQPQHDFNGSVPNADAKRKQMIPESPIPGDGHVVSGVQVWECLSGESTLADVDRLYEQMNRFSRDGECFLRGTLIAERHPESVYRHAMEIMKREQSKGTYLVIELQTWGDVDLDPNNYRY